jgi:hypothetical protein
MKTTVAEGRWLIGRDPISHETQRVMPRLSADILGMAVRG